MLAWCQCGVGVVLAWCWSVRVHVCVLVFVCVRVCVCVGVCTYVTCVFVRTVLHSAAVRDTARVRRCMCVYFVCVFVGVYTLCVYLFVCGCALIWRLSFAPFSLLRVTCACGVYVLCVCVCVCVYVNACVCVCVCMWTVARV